MSIRTIHRSLERFYAAVARFEKAIEAGGKRSNSVNVTKLRSLAAKRDAAERAFFRRHVDHLWKLRKDAARNA